MIHQLCDHEDHRLTFGKACDECFERWPCLTYRAESAEDANQRAAREAVAKDAEIRKIAAGLHEWVEASNVTPAAPVTAIAPMEAVVLLRRLAASPAARATAAGED